MVVVEVVAMPLGRIQAVARRSDDLQHSQHFLGRSLYHQRSLVAAWIDGRFAAHFTALNKILAAVLCTKYFSSSTEYKSFGFPSYSPTVNLICRHSRATVGLYDGETVCI